MFNHLHISGISNTVYEFRFYQLPHAFTEDKGGIFLFSRHIVDKFHAPIYLGITENLHKYFNNYPI